MFVLRRGRFRVNITAAIVIRMTITMAGIAIDLIYSLGAADCSEHREAASVVKRRTVKNDV